LVISAREEPGKNQQALEDPEAKFTTLAEETLSASLNFGLNPRILYISEFVSPFWKAVSETGERRKR
jgi:hypothetical protein